jgi:hypothetical protein
VGISPTGAGPAAGFEVSVGSGAANQAVLTSTTTVGVGAGGAGYLGQFTMSDVSLVCR